MPTIKARILDFEPDEEHLLRRLGGALVVQWGSLSEVNRELLLSQATLIGDREDTTQLREQLKLFIEKHQPDD
jgi:hypothetical protein